MGDLMRDLSPTRSAARAATWGVALLWGAVWLVLAPAPLAAQGARGKAVYDRWCAGCHGDSGAGDGPAATRMLPRPRDFTRGVFKIRTTASGEIPTDADLLHVVDEGMPGTAMPAWRALLSEQERRDVIAYVKSLSTFFGDQAAKPIDIGRDPGGGDRAIADGRATFQKLECFKCHGPAGRGDGKSAPTLKDDWGHPIRAADLTESWKFRGGSTVEAIYARLRTGLDGTPMPSFADAIEQKLITDENLWHVAAYVQSLSPRAPAPREVVRARLVDALPASPDDSVWDRAERYWVPVVGQVIAKPRWFTPTVDGVWVQAMHDGRRLAMRLSWHDPSRSPDPAWDEWLGRVAAATTDADAPVANSQGPDRITVEFPTRSSEDGERPYFLGGSARQPVHAWRWTSAPDRLEVGSERGLGTFAPAAGGGDAGVPVTHAARFDHGEWRLQLVRALRPSDGAQAPSFTPGRATPMVLVVADGSNGEDDVRGAVSTWYAVHLDVPTPARVYAAPATTVLLTAALGGLLVTRAQRRERQGGQPPRED
ncbi:MAG: c-type cytochrome [Gemmatimonadaceae bacterium]